MNDSIVAYIDILGYSKIVEEHYGNDEMIKGFEECLKWQVQICDNLQKIKLSKEQIEHITKKKGIAREFKKEEKENLSLIKVRLISDSLIFSLEIPEDKKDDPKLYSLYFTIIQTVCTNIISHTGLPLRGGISIGQHYESASANSLFIFSKAYLEAYQLENKKGGMPRILIHKNLSEFINNQPKQDEDDLLSRFFFTDDQGEVLLHFYHNHFSDEVNFVLKKIKKMIELNYTGNKEDNKITEKLQYFAGYHNNRIKDLILDNVKVRELELNLI
ncbi:MAG: hypothetical protein WCJ49_04970 [Deltaproteobacteria bacterium]